jgi:hypothetical protein
MNTRISEYTGITRNVLISLQPSGMIEKDLERKRGEDNYDHDGRRAAYLRGSSAYSQSIRIYDQGKIEDGRIGGNENRWTVAYHQDSPQRLHQPPQEAKRQKIKPVEDWLRTVNNLAAAGLMVDAWKTFTTAPRITLPISSIDTYGKFCQGEVQGIWACVESVYAHE